MNATTLLSGDVSAQSWEHHQLLMKSKCWPRWPCLVEGALRVRRAASWADTLSMVRRRHPLIAETMIRHLEAPCFQAVPRVEEEPEPTEIQFLSDVVVARSE